MAYTEPRKGGHIGRYRVDGRLRSTRLFTAKRDALREAEAQERSGKASEWVDPKDSTVTLAAYFDSWQSGRRVAPRTREAERERFDSLIAPTFGATPLRRLDYDDIARWSATISGKRSGEVASQARRRDATRLLVQILDSAVDARRLAHNPARTRAGKVPYLPKRSRSKPHRYLSHEQLQRVADAASSEQAGTLILFLGLTGLRWGEASALRVSDVNLVTGRVTVRRAYTRLDDGTLVLGDTKTHASREVPVKGALAERLRAQLGGKDRADLLFATEAGEPLRRESFDRNSFAPAVRAAGGAVSALQRLLGLPDETVGGVYDAATAEAVRAVQRDAGLKVSGVCDAETWQVLAQADRTRWDEYGYSRGDRIRRAHQLATLARVTLGQGAEDFERLTLHDLRHTAASLAIASGASVKAVQTMLGHESAKLTLDTYAGLFGSDLEALGDALSAAHAAASAHYVLTEAAEMAPGVTSLSARDAR